MFEDLVTQYRLYSIRQTKVNDTVANVTFSYEHRALLGTSVNTGREVFLGTLILVGYNDYRNIILLIDQRGNQGVQAVRLRPDNLPNKQVSSVRFVGEAELKELFPNASLLTDEEEADAVAFVK